MNAPALLGLAAWLQPEAPVGFTREMALQLDAAHARVRRHLNRQMFPAGEPTDADVRRRVAAICKAIGIKRKRTRRAPHPLLAAVEKAAKRTTGGPFVVRFTP